LPPGVAQAEQQHPEAEVDDVIACYRDRRDCGARGCRQVSEDQADASAPPAHHMGQGDGADPGAHDAGRVRDASPCWTELVGSGDRAHRAGCGHRCVD
jgi:hypothetical protein